MIQFFIGQKEGIAAAEEDIADFGVLADVLQSGLELGVKVVVLGIRDKPAAGAVAAIGSATVCDEEEDAVGIAVNDPVNGL